MQEETFIKRLKIVDVITETEEAKTFVLAALDGWIPQYNAGQFITFVFYTANNEKRRSFSISAAPALGEYLSITVKRVENGEYSRQLLAYAKVGDILYSTGISGFFQLPENDTRIEQYFFLAAGSGITPCYALIKTILQTGSKKIVLIYSNHTKHQTIFYKQLIALQKQYTERFKIRFLFSDIFNVHQSRLSSWLLNLLLREYISSPAKALQFYLCGPFEYMQMADITLKINGILANQIIKENYSNLPRLVIPRPPDIDAHEVAIKINDKEYTLSVQYPNSILAAAKKQHIQLPYSCEAGRCGSCAATCISGKIWMAYNEVLMEDEIEKGRILTCQGFPIGGNASIVFDI
jgi:ring-1,2-phenylacetyl-CoA epoxidase subunit PaaE